MCGDERKFIATISIHCSLYSLNSCGEDVSARAVLVFIGRLCNWRCGRGAFTGEVRWWGDS